MAVTYEAGRSCTVVVDFDDWVAARLGSEGYLATAVLEGCGERQGIYFSGSSRRLTPAARDVLSSIG
jgi:hypothetical protein